MIRRLQPHATVEGSDDLVSDLNRPSAEDEARTLAAPEGTAVPASIQRKVERCLNETVTRWSSAMSLPPAKYCTRPSAGDIRTQGNGPFEPTLRPLYAAIYRAFRRRRSLSGSGEAGVRSKNCRGLRRSIVSEARVCRREDCRNRLSRKSSPWWSRRFHTQSCRTSSFRNCERSPKAPTCRSLSWTRWQLTFSWGVLWQVRRVSASGLRDPRPVALREVLRH